jgi:hypothetical protein
MDYFHPKLFVAQFPARRLVKQEGIEYREIQEMEEQLFPPLPCSTTYAVGV